VARQAQTGDVHRQPPHSAKHPEIACEAPAVIHRGMVNVTRMDDTSDGIETDVDIYETLGDGDGQAMEIAYDRYGGLAYGLALRILRDSGRAEDVVQEVFLGLWQRPGSFDPQKAAGFSSSF
jgi:hypothetical protein